MLPLALSLAAPLQSSDYIVVRLDEPGALVGEPLAGDGLTLRVPVVADAEDEARQIMLLPGVAWAHPDWLVELEFHTDDPLFQDQWHLDNTGQDGRYPAVDVNGSEAWDWTNGSGVIIAIVDSGVDSEHPDLLQVPGWDYVDDDEDASPNPDSDAYAHGTATAGVAASIGDNDLGGAGVAWGAEIMPVRLIDGAVSMSTIHDAWVEAAENGAQVISNSWSFSSQDCQPFNSIALLDLAIETVDELGALLVMSAGNSSCDISGDGLHQNPLLTSVGAITDHDTLTGYSNFGEIVDIVAPSDGIVTTDIVGEGGYSGDDYYSHYSGTSASAPMVAGVYALMFAVNARLSPQAAREMLCATAVRNDPSGGEWGSDGHSPWYGCGRVDAGAAVAAVYNEGAPTLLVEDLATYKDEALIQWSGWDPDGDVVSYLLEVDGDPVQEGLQSSFLLDEEELKVGDVVEFEVTPYDLWGPGESVSASLEILRKPRPEEATGSCGTNSPPWLGYGALLLLCRRRRVNAAVAEA